MPNFIEGIKDVNNFWWDINNDFMVCFGKEYADKVKIAMTKLKEKWSK